MYDEMHWVCHACFYIKAKGITIFIDPFRISDVVKEKADLILVTHAHFDHNSKDDIEKVRTRDTVFVGAEKCFDDMGYERVMRAKPGFKKNFEGIIVEAVPAYNTMNGRLQFHPKESNWVGYIIDVDGKRIYHAGDTDIIPEMGQLKDIDTALLPMGGTYTMTMDEAIEAANIIKPKHVVPMHYKTLLGESGSKELEKNVKSRLGNAIIMREVQEPVYSF